MQDVKRCCGAMYCFRRNFGNQVGNCNRMGSFVFKYRCARRRMSLVPKFLLSGVNE